MKVTRLSKAAFFLLVAATLSGTLWILPSRFRVVAAEQRREATPLSSSVMFFASPAFFGDQIVGIAGHRGLYRR
jgi:hypothetical protein